MAHYANRARETVDENGCARASDYCANVTETCNNTAMKMLFRMLFVAAPSIKHCLFSSPANSLESFHASPLSEYFTLVDVGESSTPVEVIMACCNQAVLSQPLYVRPAKPEDFDDLRPVFNRQSDVLRTQYGGDLFYLAELIEASTQTEVSKINRCLAAEVGGRAVGMMALSTEVDLTVLRQCFDLTPFGGLQSAVAVTLFCIEPQYESHSLDFMAEVFAAYAEVEYCVITMPHDITELPLLQNFMKVSATATSTLPHDLWVMHRDSLLENLSVRPFRSDDCDSVGELLQHLDSREQVLAALSDSAAAFAEAVDAGDTAVVPEAFLVMSGSSAVGVVQCIGAKDEAAQVRAHYDIEDFVLYAQHASYEHGFLNHFVLNPIFERHSKFVLREVMRIGGKSCIYHRLYASCDVESMMNAPSPPTCLDYLVPVRRRKQIDYPHHVLMTNVPSKRVRELDPPYALAFMNRKLLLEPKVAVNARIVVVGNSETGLSFVEQLVYKSHLRFGNLILVSSDGLDEGPACGMSTHAYSSADRKAIAWDVWADIVQDSLTCINRSAQVLTLASGAEIPYDYLVLAPDLVYAADGAPREAPVDVSMHVVNSGADFQGLKEDVCRTAGPVVIYGSSLDALGFTTGLLKSPVDASRITLVSPDFDTTTGGDKLVEAAIVSSFTQTGVTLLREDFVNGEDGAGLSMQDGTNVVRVPCETFVYAARKTVNKAFFHAVNDACLVFDGKLVVNNRFQTNDERIYAAGPATKFSRKYYAGKSHPFAFNAKEVGVQLARSLLARLDPLAEDYEMGSVELPEFDSPLVTSIGLPNGHRLLQVKPPGSVAERGGSATTISTSKKEEPENYFSLTFNEHRSVHKMTCVAPEGAYSVSNLISLYGIHELLLNSVVKQHKEGLVLDLFSFFEEAWSMALYHDRFRSYMSEILEEIAQNPAVDITAFSSSSRKLAAFRAKTEDDDFWDAKDSELLSEAVGHISEQGVGELTRIRLMEFLERHSNHLPMYTRGHAF